MGLDLGNDNWERLGPGLYRDPRGWIMLRLDEWIEGHGIPDSPQARQAAITAGVRFTLDRGTSLEVR